MRSVVVTAGPFAAASATRFVNAVVPTSGAPLTLATTVVDAVQRRILLTVGSEGSARTLVLVGTNAAGNLITETVAVAASSAGTIISALDYLTLISATPLGGGWTAALNLGTTAATTSGSSPWVRSDDYGLGPTEISCTAVATVNYTVEYSDDDPNLVPPQVAVPPASMTWFPDATIAAQTGNKNAVITASPKWARVTVNSYSAAGQVTMNFRQTGGMIGA